MGIQGNPESLSKVSQVDRDSVDATSAPTVNKLLPRETGQDIGMGSPVPLSKEAVEVITRLRNMKVCFPVLNMPIPMFT